MCQQCSNPESPEGRGLRDYLKSIGKNFSEEEITRKTKGLVSLSDPFLKDNAQFTRELDSMPDGIHAKPRKYWAQVHLQSNRLKIHKTAKAAQHCAELRDRYASLPEPKPEYLVWASEQSRPQLFDELFRQATRADNPMARVKAISTILEFTKSKPKTELEVIQKDFSGELPDLFRQLAQLAGVPPEAIETFVGSYLEKSPATN